MFNALSCAAALTGALLTALPGNAAAQAQSRGELLYSTHCISCHTTEIHWRDRKVATDLNSLRLQVRRWQGTTGLGWSESDVDEVTRYLNESIYRYPANADPAAEQVPSDARHGIHLPGERRHDIPSVGVLLRDPAPNRRLQSGWIPEKP